MRNRFCPTNSYRYWILTFTSSNFETLEHRVLTFKLIDMTTYAADRPRWRFFFDQIMAIIFVIDSNDPGRFDETLEELSRLAKEDELADLPFLIFANKQDLPVFSSPFIFNCKMMLIYLTEYIPS